MTINSHERNVKRMNTEKRTITVYELQEQLQIGRAKAYELVNSKGFPSLRVGRKILVSVEGLKKWIEQGGEKCDN